MDPWGGELGGLSASGRWGIPLPTPHTHLTPCSETPDQIVDDPLWNRVPKQLEERQTSHPRPININMAFSQRPGRIQQSPHVSSDIWKFMDGCVNRLSKANSEVCERFFFVFGWITSQFTRSEVETIFVSHHLTTTFTLLYTSNSVKSPRISEIHLPLRSNFLDQPLKQNIILIVPFQQSSSRGRISRRESLFFRPNWEVELFDPLLVPPCEPDSGMRTQNRRWI
jgi:hypothetical protein